MRFSVCHARTIAFMVCVLTAMMIIILFWTQPLAAGDATTILKELSKIKNLDPNFKVDLKTLGDRDSFKVGETVTLSFTTNMDCYLTLISIGSSGKPVIIFPNQWEKSAFVKAGREYLVPPRDSNFHFIASEPAGVEVVKAIATSEPLDFISSASLSNAGPFQVIENPKIVSKGLVAAAGRKDNRRWSTSEIAISIQNTEYDSKPDK